MRAGFCFHTTIGDVMFFVETNFLQIKKLKKILPTFVLKKIIKTIAMEAIKITAYPKDNSQIEAIKAVMKAFKIKFEIADKPYNVEFVNKILDAEKEIKEGKGLKVTSQEFDDLWK